MISAQKIFMTDSDQELSKAAPIVTEDDEIRLALLALGGCPTCGKSLKRRCVDDNHFFYCCGIVYCPFCGRSQRKRCEHLAASHVSYRWRLGDRRVIIPENAIFPYHEDGLKYSDREWCNAFGSEWHYYQMLILESRWGDCTFFPSKFVRRLVAHRLPNSISIYDDCTFQRDLSGFKDVLDQDFRVVTEGLIRLTANPPFVRRFQKNFMTKGWYQRQSFFTTDGSYCGNISTRHDATLDYWDVKTGKGGNYVWKDKGGTKDTWRSSAKLIINRVMQNSVDVTLVSLDSSFNRESWRCDFQTGERFRLDRTLDRIARLPHHFNKPKPFPSGTDTVIEKRSYRCPFLYRKMLTLTIRHANAPVIKLEFDYEPSQIILSPDGEHLLVDAKSGGVALYQITAADVREAIESASKEG